MFFKAYGIKFLYRARAAFLVTRNERNFNGKSCEYLSQAETHQSKLDLYKCGNIHEKLLTSVYCLIGSKNQQL